MSDVSSKWLDEVDVAVVSHNGRQTLPRVLAWDRDYATPEERKLAEAANARSGLKRLRTRTS